MLLNSHTFQSIALATPKAIKCQCTFQIYCWSEDGPTFILRLWLTDSLHIFSFCPCWVHSVDRKYSGSMLTRSVMGLPINSLVTGSFLPFFSQYPDHLQGLGKSHPKKFVFIKKQQFNNMHHNILSLLALQFEVCYFHISICGYRKKISLVWLCGAEGQLKYMLN